MQELLKVDQSNIEERVTFSLDSNDNNHVTIVTIFSFNTTQINWCPIIHILLLMIQCCFPRIFNLKTCVVVHQFSFLQIEFPLPSIYFCSQHCQYWWQSGWWPGPLVPWRGGRSSRAWGRATTGALLPGIGTRVAQPGLDSLTNLRCSHKRFC